VRPRVRRHRREVLPPDPRGAALSAVDKIQALLLAATLITVIAWALVREHRLELEEARRNLDRRPTSDEYMDAIDARLDEVAVRPHGQVENVVPLHSRKRGPAA
jgi:hypothetical protein